MSHSEKLFLSEIAEPVDKSVDNLWTVWGQNVSPTVLGNLV